MCTDTPQSSLKPVVEVESWRFTRAAIIRGRVADTYPHDPNRPAAHCARRAQTLRHRLRNSGLAK
jgi:hypothetical protein